MQYRLTISDFRKITACIKTVYGIDYTNYALTSIKRRFENLISDSKYTDIDSFNEALCVDSNFFQSTLYKLTVADTEMFRDPAAWQEIKNIVIPAILNQGNVKIWIPGSTTGEELVSLVLVLEELKVLSMVEIIVSSGIEQNLERIRNGIFETKTFELNIANYGRFEGKLPFKLYFTEKNGKMVFNPEIMNSLKFEVIDIERDPLPTNVNLCLYRNAMIYFNKSMQSEIIDRIHRSLVPGGFLLIGVKESLDGLNVDRKFLEIIPSEGIYKRSYL